LGTEPGHGGGRCALLSPPGHRRGLPIRRFTLARGGVTSPRGPFFLRPM